MKWMFDIIQMKNYEVENVLLRTRVVKRDVGHGTPTIIFHFKCFQTRKI